MTCGHSLLLVLLLLRAWCGSSLPQNSAAGRAAPCVISNALAVSDYVKAWHSEVKVNVTGCQSQQVSTIGQHVVVIHYAGPAVAANITVNLRPATGGTEDSVLVPTVLVLLSDQPSVTWRITTVRVLRDLLSAIQVGGGAQVVKERRVKAPVSQLQQQLTNGNSADHVTWLVRQFGGVTSYTRLTQPSNHVDVVLGSADVGAASNTCVPVATTTAGHVTVSTVTSLPVDGCAAPSNRGRGGKDVHILELVPSPTQLASSPSGIKPLVTVNIGVVSGSVVQVHLVLVLQSQLSVNWRITSQGIRGSVDIITDDPVNTDDVDVNSLRVAAERLRARTGASLVEWVEEKYGAPVSYTRAANANLWHLTVDSPVSRPSVDSTSTVKTGAVQSTLPKLTTVTCAKAGLTVALRRDLLENFGVRRSQLSLAERSCGATENATHFILHTPFTDCSTRVDVSDGAIVYVNKVFVYRSNVVAAQLEVQCATNIHTSSGADVSSIQRPTYEMSLYADGFSHIVILPAQVASHSTLHVEAVLVQPESGIGLNVDKCWLSVVPQSQLQSAPYWNLVTAGCADVSSLQWYDAELPAGEWRLRRFSFSLNEFDVLNKTVDVSCELSLCAVAGHSGANPSLAQCQLQTDYCQTSAQRLTPGVWSKVSRLPAALHVVQQPQVPQLLSTTAASVQPVQAVLQAVASDQCHTQQTRVRGLDTKLVVIVAFSAFVVGVVLMSTVWLIHSRTGKRRRRQQVSRKTPADTNAAPSTMIPFLVQPTRPDSAL